MNPLDAIIYTVGFATLTWWTFGFVLFLFFTKVYVGPNIPFTVKVTTVFVSGFTLPWMLLSVGSLPMAMISKLPEYMTPEEKAHMAAWAKEHDNCQCASCRARRGE